MRAAKFALFVFTLVVASAGSAFAHGDVMRIGSTEAGGGQIVVLPEFVFGSDVFHLPFITELGSLRLYSEIFPSFAWILAETDGIQPLSAEVEVDFTVAAPISAGASVRLGGRTLEAPGEAASLGGFVNDPEAHVHPEWRLLLADGVTGQYEVSFRLSADGFADSPVYTVLITNEEPAVTPTPDATAEPTGEGTSTPTVTFEPTADTTATPPTDTATPTHTLPAPTCAGDCDGNGSVSIAELVRAVGLALEGGTSTCAAADVNGDGTIAINELIRAVRSALEGCDS